MNTPTTRARRKPPALLALLTSFLVVLSGLFVAPTMATAAEAAGGSVSAGVLDWGVRDTWRAYISNPSNSGGGTTVTSPATEPPTYRWDSAGTGSFDGNGGTLNTSGVVNWSFPTHGINLTVKDLSVNFDIAAGTGSIVGTYSNPDRLGGAIPETREVMANISLAGADVYVGAGTVTVSGAAATVAAGSLAAFEGFYVLGEPMDSVSFSFNYQQTSESTETTLNVAPSNTVSVNDTVTLTASVLPATVPGSVVFFAGDVAVSDEIAVTEGTASFSTSTLAAGSHELTATFTPAAGQLFLSSTSAASTLVVEIPDTAVDTTTTLAAPIPAAPAVLGAAVELSATVAASEGTPAGTVNFYSIAAGSGERMLLGSESVEGDTATFSTSSLAQGGYTFAAIFHPADQAEFRTSEGLTTANYNVIDVATVTHCEVPLGVDSAGELATATWRWSSYFDSMGGLRSGKVM